MFTEKEPAPWRRWCLTTLLLVGSLGAPCTTLATPWPQTDDVVFLASGLSEEESICLPVLLAASGHAGVWLEDTPRYRQRLREFLARYQPRSVIALGHFPEGQEELAQALGVPRAHLQCPQRKDLHSWLSFLFPRPSQLVVAPAGERRLLLEAAWLAGILQAPLLVGSGRPEEQAWVQQFLAPGSCDTLWIIGAARQWCPALVAGACRFLADEAAVLAAGARQLSKKGNINTIVIANPADRQRGLADLSHLAPWVAVTKRAVLLLTRADGRDVAERVQAALRLPGLGRADNLFLLGDLAALPCERRPNPVPGGKDAFIEMEPLTPQGREPFSFAVGRLFHPEPAMVPLVLARGRLWQRQPARKVLLVSDPGSGLPLLEALSRSTVQELENAGYQTTALVGPSASAARVRELLATQDLFVWEGHYSTLSRTYKIPFWDDALKPSLCLLQSCLALAPAEALPFLERGAVGVLGAPNRTYSASGGALALAYVDALVYEQQSLGGALRQAKNFLLAFSVWKQRRRGEGPLAQAGVRTAWAFALWGDPTLPGPRPPATPRRPPITYQLRGRRLTLRIPEEMHAPVASEGYEVQMPANARLAGWCAPGRGTASWLVPFAFVEVPLPAVPDGHAPQLQGRLSSRHWVFLWDGRRRCGYLLVRLPQPCPPTLTFWLSW